MDLNISDKVALVTGSTQGIGFATAKLLAQEGAEVIVNGRSDKKVQEAVAKIKDSVKDAKVRGVVADLEDAVGCKVLTDSVKEVDILINNVGIFEPVDFLEITEAQWLEMFNVNVMSGVRLTQHYLPSMFEKDWGRIEFISSESAYQIPQEMIHYGMTKTAQISLARGIAETTKGTGVTCNSIIVGPTSSEGVTDFIENLAKVNNQSFKEVEKEFFQSIRPTSLLQRFSTSEEIANLIVYTASTLASATNGAALRVDAGVVRAAV
jgi:NAD(P)-dependent dehydrogenase (short-subunit alcohol dehydrogenase family)